MDCRKKTKQKLNQSSKKVIECRWKIKEKW